MSDETGLERAERNFRALVRCRSNGGGLEAFLAEYDRRGAERDEALALLRELVAGADDSRCWYVPMLGEIRVLVERAGPAGAHSAGSGDSS